jgi:mono/diheme cytochrome c family protein
MLRAAERRWINWYRTGAVALILQLAGCNSCQSKSASSTATQDPAAALRQRGKTVYATNCTSCHAADPKMEGALGPAVMGSSRELLEARIVHGNYPEGYQPKRDSKVMVALPHLKSEIEALSVYLQAP